MDGTVISGRWGEPDDVAGRWADDPYPPPYDDPYGYGEPYGDHYGEPYGDAYDRSGLGMLTRITVIKDRIVDIEKLPYSPKGGEYLAFLGRISPEKGLEHAITIAQEAGLPLKVK